MFCHRPAQLAKHCQKTDYYYPKGTTRALGQLNVPRLVAILLFLVQDLMMCCLPWVLLLQPSIVLSVLCAFAFSEALRYVASFLMSRFKPWISNSPQFIVLELCSCHPFFKPVRTHIRYHDSTQQLAVRCNGFLPTICFTFVLSSPQVSLVSCFLLSSLLDVSTYTHIFSCLHLSFLFQPAPLTGIMRVRVRVFIQPLVSIVLRKLHLLV